MTFGHERVRAGIHPGLDRLASVLRLPLDLVRDGNKVWLAWYGNGSTNGSNGIFVKQIEPSVGATT